MDRNRERELVARLAEGDVDAFDALYEAYRPRLFSFLVRLTRRRDSAEDLLQETWLRLARSAGTLDRETRVGAWLFTVARNLFVSYRRWAVLDVDRLSELSFLPLGSAGAETPFEHASANELEARVERALAALPLAYREAILLVAVERMTPTEASEILGLTPEAMRQRLSRARARLGELLGELAEDPSPA